jgi:hypothetical protein
VPPGWWRYHAARHSCGSSVAARQSEPGPIGKAYCRATVTSDPGARMHDGAADTAVAASAPVYQLSQPHLISGLTMGAEK